MIRVSLGSAVTASATTAPATADKNTRPTCRNGQATGATVDAGYSLLGSINVRLH